MSDIESLAFRAVSLQGGQGCTQFDAIDFEFPANEIVLLGGSAGAGKSLLLKAMAGLVLPTGGGYYINEVNVSQLSFAGFLPYRLNIGYSFEQGGLISNKTVYENLALPLLFHQLGSADEIAYKVSSLLEQFSLTSVQDVRPAELSSSFKRLAVVARSLILDPQLLLLDHPTTGLCNADRLALADLLKYKKLKGELKHIFIVSRQETFLDGLISCQIQADNHEIIRA